MNSQTRAFLLPRFSASAAARTLYAMWPARQLEITYDDLSPESKTSFRKSAAQIVRAALKEGARRADRARGSR
jgi:hypothetical protein